MKTSGFALRPDHLGALLLALTLTIVVHASAVADDDVANTLEQWGRSLGGREALSKIDNYHLHYQLETGGLTGTLDVWQAADGRRRIEIEHGGVYTYTSIFDGTMSFTSANGARFREDAGTDLATVITYAYVESFSMLLPDRMDAHCPPVANVHENVTVCTLTPVCDFPVQYYLGDDFLPDSSAISSDGRRMVTQYSQWKSVDGVAWPHTQLLTSGDPRFDERYTLQAIETNLDLDDALFNRPPEQLSRVRFPAGATHVDVRMDLFGNHIFIPVHINELDTTLWFIFDTGAEMSVLNRDRIAPLGMAAAGVTEGRGVGENSVEVSFATGVSLDIGGMKIEDLTVAAIAMDQFTERLGRGFDGIIGGDIISEITSRVDYRDSTMTMFASGEFSPPADATPLELSFDGNVPFAELSIKTHNGTQARGRVLLDTGNRAGISIYRHFAAANQLIGDGISSVEAPSGFGVGGPTTAQFVRVPEVSFGGATIANALVAVELGRESEDSVNYEIGSIGGDCFRFLTLTFDYSAKTVWVEQAYETIAPGELDMFGATIVDREGNGGTGGFEITSLLSGSPAEQSDLKAGDLIVAIDDVPVSEFTLPDVRRLFQSQSGVTIAISYLRHDTPRRTHVTLRRMI